MSVGNLLLNKEREVKVFDGKIMLPLVLFLVLGSTALFIYSIVHGANTDGAPVWNLLFLSKCIVFMIRICNYMTNGFGKGLIGIQEMKVQKKIPVMGEYLQGLNKSF